MPEVPGCLYRIGAPSAHGMALLAVALLAPMRLSASESGIKLYVDPNGDDNWSGKVAQPTPDRSDGPMASIHAAQRALRKESRDRHRTILIRGGLHRLARPIEIGPEDSGGGADAPTVFAAYPGERPVLSGGRHITGFHREGAGVWVASLPEVKAGRWNFNQLFVNGQRRQCARIPNEGYLRMAGPAPPGRGPDSGDVSRAKTAFAFQQGDLEPWADLPAVRLTLMHSWETSVHRIRSIDPVTRIVELAAALKEWWKIGHWESNGRYFVEGAREGLDRPGEWHLDRSTSTLRYIPLADEKMDDAEVVAPLLEALVAVRGDPAGGRPVAHVRLEGLAFHHCDWIFRPDGNSSTQAAVDEPAAIIADGAQAFAIIGCEIAHIGTHGIWMRRGCRDCRIERNHLYDLGAGGIRIGECGMAKDDIDETRHTTVDNNYMHDGGRVFPAGPGIWLAQSSGNKISHNEVHSFNYSGMSLGWNWNEAPNRTHSNLVEFNHVHHVMGGMLSDGGGIYTLGTQHGTAIRNNIFHDIWPYMGNPAMAWGIYLDAGSNGLLIERNIVYNTLTGGIMNTGQNRNVIRNNIFASSAWHAIWRYTRQKGEPSRFEQNIIYLTQGQLFHDDGGKTDFQTVWDRNLYWRTDGLPLEFYGRNLNDWRSKGPDRGSLIADPGFVSADRGDYRLRADSPAPVAIGFEPIDPGACGLYGDPEWVALPKRAVFAPTVLPPVPPPPAPKPILDGFETTAEGAPPSGARVFGNESASGGRIRVTKGLARAGSQALEVIDSAALKEPWNPHFFYAPQFRAGVASLRFWMLIQPAAHLAIEWRDDSQPYRVGPSLAVRDDGQIIAGGRALTRVPLDRWVGIEISCGLGKSADGRWRLGVTLPDETRRNFADLRCRDPQFKSLAWLGFISLGADKSRFLLDDLSLTNGVPVAMGAGGPGNSAR